MKYPATRQIKQIDDYHGTPINDPYRWLEDDTAPEVKQWVTAQNEVTQSYLNQIPYREQIKARYTTLFNYLKLNVSQKVGEYYIFYKNEGLQNQSTIYIKEGLQGEESILIDPNTLSEDGTVTINILEASLDNRYVTYAKAEAGSDWQEIYILDLHTHQTLPDCLKWIKFTDISWTENGFYYSRYPAPEQGKEFSNANKHHTVHFHELGTAQSDDQLVYENRAAPLQYHYANVTEDGKYLILYAATGTDGYECYYKDLATDGKEFTALFTGFKHKNTVIDHHEGRFLVRTDIDAPKYRLVSIDPLAPSPDNWITVLPEQADLLQQVTIAGGKLFVSYLKNVTAQVYQFNLDGSQKQVLELPEIGSVGGMFGKKKDGTLLYQFSSFSHPSTIYVYDVEKGISTPFFEPQLAFDSKAYITKQVFFPSKDGTKVSMFIVHKKGLELDGKRPTYLYGYGGFNVSLTPSFSTSRMILLENDGVFVIANLRGGGEYGEEWHKGGMLNNKQNVFDDFIAAAEYLIAQNYTSSETLAIAGGSNGGLLVGACMTQRPELFKVAFPAVGVMDMLRYHKFTVGWGWIPEYGSSDKEADFHNLLSYSPLHQLKEGVVYPATMVMTADHDDRVVPAHSFKFIARLQATHAGNSTIPVLIRIEERAGHGAGTPSYKIIEEETDRWAFLFHTLFGDDFKYQIANMD